MCLIMKKEEIIAIISVLLVALTLIIPFLTKLSLVPVIVLILILFPLSFSNLYLKEKCWPRTISKLILMFPLILILLGIFITLFKVKPWTHPTDYTIFWRYVPYILTAVGILCVIAMGTLIFTFDKNTSSKAHKVALITFGILIYLFIIIMSSLLIAFGSSSM